MVQTPAPTQVAPQGTADQGGADFNNPSVRILMAAAKIIYTDPKPFLNIIRQAPNPQDGIVRCVDIILRKIAQSAKGVPPEQVQKLMPMIGQKLGPIVGNLLAEIAIAAGLMRGAAPQGAEAQPLSGAPQ